MYSNYPKIAFRNLFKNKVYSLVNIGGMAMGITAFILILEYVSLEKSVDKFHSNINLTYRLLNESTKGEMWQQHAPGWVNLIKKEIPEITSFCRFDDGNGRGIVTYAEKNLAFKEEKVSYADGNFFDFFSFPLILGEAQDFNHANVVFISENHARKYFGNENPIGKLLVLNNQFGTQNYTVGGVFSDMGEHSSIRFDMFFSLQTLQNPSNLNGNDWAALDNIDSQYIDIYFSIQGQSDYKKVEGKLNNLRKIHDRDSDGSIFRLQPFTEVHLASSINDKAPHTGDVKYIYMLLGIAFLILLIAWFNYINLSTANSLKRAGEVGVRKVVGATQKNLIYQFLVESVLINLIAVALALILIFMIQPLFNKLMDKPMTLTNLLDAPIWSFSFLGLILGSLGVGTYTAYLLSKFNPIQTLKGKFSKSNTGVFLRKSLVVSQFGISVGLVLTTVLIYSQLQYMRNKDHGLNLDQLLVINGPEVGKDSTLVNRETAFFNELEKQSFIKDFAGSQSVPSKGYNFRTGGFTQPASKPGDETKSYAFSIVGDRYFNAYGIQFIAGRNFTKSECDVEWNDNNKVILNETALTELGFASAEDAIRTKIKWDERYLEVIGVIQDYNHLSLKSKIDPIIFYPQTSSGFITIRLTPENMSDKIASLEKIYQKYFTGNPFEFTFIDQNFYHSYASEQQYGSLFTTASVWAIFIACLGLFGLATFTVESRTKEIGIRKVLGGSVLSISSALYKDFMMLIVIALVISMPMTYVFLDHWLDNFPYRTQITWIHFLITVVVAIGFSILAMSYQVLQAAFMNPVKSLRTE